jgi:hypothetical protein
LARGASLIKTGARTSRRVQGGLAKRNPPTEMKRSVDYALR